MPSSTRTWSRRATFPVPVPSRPAPASTAAMRSSPSRMRWTWQNATNSFIELPRSSRTSWAIAVSSNGWWPRQKRAGPSVLGGAPGRTHCRPAPENVVKNGMGHSRPHHFPQNCNSASRMAGGAVRFWRPINTFPRNLYGVGMAADTWFEFTLSFPLLSTEVVT